MKKFELGDDLPTHGRRKYRKISLTTMVRVEGPFIVETSEGPLQCEDGFVAKDARGYLYPIASDEHAKIYVEEL